MNKVITIAVREFLSVVATKGFLIGMFLPPVLIGAVLTVFPLLMNKKPPSVSGHIAIIDRSGGVADRLADSFEPDKVKARRNDKIRESIRQGTDRLNLDPKVADEAQKSVYSAPNLDAAVPTPTLNVVTLPKDADIETEKTPILGVTGKESDPSKDRRLVLVVIPEGAVTARPDVPEEERYEKYQLFVAPRLDMEVQQDIKDQVASAIVDARLSSASYDVATVRSIMKRPAADSKAVTKEGDRTSNELAKFLIPASFMILLWISVFTSGQYLMTSTIEEKSNRVMEVLLSAASPLQLMLGKVLGKGAVGLLIIAVYGSVGGLALVAFTLTHLLEWQNLIYLAVYFVCAYFIVASLFVAVGSAVTELVEAQTLQTPVMIVLMIPMMLWMPIMRNPNSQFAQVCSFMPIINPFVMVLRLSGSEPVPFWQVPVSMLVGILTVVVLVWAAAKIFRIGVLMYGKPPNFTTLLRWVRMA
ncbi:MAG TPA: ABC transporter permease [Phycisphaerales bacterium]|nr:ABC transporter permease [Phycisphaerales bacterium]